MTATTGNYLHCSPVTWVSFHSLSHPPKSVLRLLAFSGAWKSPRGHFTLRNDMSLWGKVWTFFLEYHHHDQNQQVCQNPWCDLLQWSKFVSNCKRSIFPFQRQPDKAGQKNKVMSWSWASIIHNRCQNSFLVCYKLFTLLNIVPSHFPSDEDCWVNTVYSE